MESTYVPFASYDFVSVPTIVPLFRPIFSPTKPSSSLPFDQVFDPIPFHYQKLESPYRSWHWRLRLVPHLFVSGFAKN
ncbi:hypothetical protein AB3S75_009585 [Citrus x aurantiifolia]